ncbi:class I SAM-dependent methyltransferase [Burkholderia pyrrocinia]|uniref:class I SAM-dependent methyltransferase n=1 Tax=Burkholderia pyrrocinia TaxID=60550 RepID=UPI0032679FC0
MFAYPYNGAHSGKVRLCWGKHISSHAPPVVRFVHETAFQTEFCALVPGITAASRVATNDLKRPINTPLVGVPTIAAAGCGPGISSRQLANAFRPSRIIGIDHHEPSLEIAAAVAHASQPIIRNISGIDVLNGDCARLALPSASRDIVFCHQTFITSLSRIVPLPNSNAS